MEIGFGFGPLTALGLARHAGGPPGPPEGWPSGLVLAAWPVLLPSQEPTTPCRSGVS